MAHQAMPEESGMPLIPEGSHPRVALASVIFEIHILTKEALPKEISREIRSSRGTPGLLEQKALTFGRDYALKIDELIDSFAKVITKTHPELKEKIDQSHRIFKQAFDEEIQRIADRIHGASTFEKAKTAALNCLNGSFKVNIEQSFQFFANTIEDFVNRVL